MPRSSKHKSSKHGSRDAREHSDSERDSGLKDHRKGKDESVPTKALRDSGSSEKRKVDSKDGTGNGEHSDEYYGTSKRRKERSGDGGGERRNGDEDERGRGDGKQHRDLGRKESRESAAKVKEGRSERSVDNEDLRMSKQGYENTDLRKVDELQSTELDNQLERRMRKKRESGDSDKHQDDVGDSYDRHLSLRDEIAKDGRQKDGKRKDEKYRDKCREETDRENKRRHDKQRDEHPAKDHTSIKSGDRHEREEKHSLELRQKRTKLPEGDRDQDHNRERDRDLESGRDREQRNERDYDLDRDRDYDRDQDWYWDRDRDRDRDHDRHRRRDRDGSHVDDRSAKSKDSGAKKRTLNDHDDYTDAKSRVTKGQYPDGEKRSLSSSKADSDVDRGRSQPRQAYADSTGTVKRHRSSPASNTHIGKDEYRNANSDDPMYRESMIEQRTKGSREGFSGISERGPKYKSMEKPFKIDDGPVGDLSTGRSSSAKAAPKGQMERSPSISIERRYMNKSGVRQSLEIEERGRRNSVEGRDFSTSDDRLGRELTQEKPPLEEPPQAESSFYGRGSQGNASLIPPPPAFRAALDRPFMGSLEDDVRDNSSTRYRRSNDPGFGRGHGNSWRAVPNWTSPVPNAFVPFQHGPAHGGFQAMMPQFTSQPLFGVRPSVDVNHAGIPYHIGDVDRFPGHLRPLGWQNVMDGTGPAHLRGWESNNGVFRDDPHMYGGSDWDRNRHSTNSRGWESGSETWKEQNGDSEDLPSLAGKDESVPALVNDGLTNQSIQVSRDDEHNRDEFHEKSPETKSSCVRSPAKVALNSLSTTACKKGLDSSTPSDNPALFSQFYLSKLDISADLVIPELYDQCMCLVNVDKNTSIDADVSAKLFQKNGSRARKIYAATFSRHSPLPAIDDSLFQRAIDLYKKQRTELLSDGKVDVISASNQVLVDESVPLPSLGNEQISASASDEMEDVPMPPFEHKKMEALSPAKDYLEEIDQTCSQKELDHDCTHSSKLVISSPSCGHEKQREPVAGLCEKEDKVIFDMVNSGDAEDNSPMAFKNEFQLSPTLHDDGEMNNKAKSTSFAHRADENRGFDDTMVSPLIFEDGSPRTCDALMPGSNESESLILSRIHHSPESTH